MELLDIYDTNGKLTGKTIIRGDKSVKLLDGEHIAVSVIFIENSLGKFLIQKTSAAKGGKYSSTGGHIDSGETPLIAIKRETKEELGISIDNDNIIYCGYLLYDKPIRHIFYVKKDINLKKIKLQIEEVESVKYMTISEIEEIIDNGTMLESHGKMFKKMLEYKKFKK